MDSIAGYASSSSSCEEGDTPGKSTSASKSVPASSVHGASRDLSELKQRLGIAATPGSAAGPAEAAYQFAATAGSTSDSVPFNTPSSAMWMVAQQQQQQNLPSGAGYSVMGRVSNAAVNDWTFRRQHHAFQGSGQAADPSGTSQQVVRTGAAAAEQRKRRRREQSGQPGTGTFKGPWAASVEPEDVDLDKAGLENAADAAETEEESAGAAAQAPSASAAAAEDAEAQAGDAKRRKQPSEHSVFHGKQLHDYQGRTYMAAPSGIRVPDYGNGDAYRSFLPRRLLHTYTGHSKGVSRIRLFPETGHLLLSAGLDGKVKLWSVYGARRVLRTFHGHKQGVRDVAFSADGTRFVSASYDNYCKVWDTETDKKIIQWDTNTGNIVQEYDQHLGSVNAVLFIDDGRRFLSTSDDKSIRIWDWEIPVTIKYISDPTMHSVPAVTLAPNNKYFLAQSLDNNLLCYSARDRYQLNRKKRFHGHNVAGYACGAGWSYDMQYVFSGDSSGALWFWGWRDSRLIRKLPAHDDIVSDALWHPIEPGQVVSASWDKTIKLWG